MQATPDHEPLRCLLQASMHLILESVLGRGAMTGTACVTLSDIMKASPLPSPTCAPQKEPSGQQKEIYMMGKCQGIAAVLLLLGRSCFILQA